MARKKEKRLTIMITLNDYLYDGSTVLKILNCYAFDLGKDAERTGNILDSAHAEMLLQISDFLQHQEFLTSQSQRIREFFTYLTKEYPQLSITFKGRIKSLIRAEEKFNGYIVEYIYSHYKKYKEFPDVHDLHNKVRRFRDLVAYRFVISLPKDEVPAGADRKEEELRILYEIANQMPDFLKDRGLHAEISMDKESTKSDLFGENIRPFFKDYITNPTALGYRSLHITLYDSIADSYLEVQLRTKEMDDFAEIGPANHIGYKKQQERERRRRDTVPVGKNIYFDEAYKRGLILQQLDLTEIDVNMFSAVEGNLFNDGCGFLMGRQLLPSEHLPGIELDAIK